MEFEKYHKIKRLGDTENKEIFSTPNDTIYVQEKIDGANFRFYVSKGKLIFGSRTQQLTSNEGEDTNVSKNFKLCVEFIREQTKDINLEVYEGLIFYGECCIKHTITYDWDNMPLFLGFDIKDCDGDYLPLLQTQNLFKSLNLDTVPIVKVVQAKDINLPITDDDVPISKYALKSSDDRKAEGIVFKNYNKQMFAKYVRDVFKEKNCSVFGGSPKYNKVDDTDNSEFVFKYCTNPRIGKLILKKLDNGEELNMKMMGSLIKDTYQDIIEEEWREILNSNWKLDFKNIRKSIAKRVRHVLDQFIQINEREK